MEVKKLGCHRQLLVGMIVERKDHASERFGAPFHFFQSMRYFIPSRVHLRHIHKPDPKAFFLRLSLGGCTPKLKIEDFYNVDFHSALTWPGVVLCPCKYDDI